MIYQHIANFQKNGIDMVLVTAVDKQGEGPVEVGKKMLITQDQHIGTVGGGALEHYAMQVAYECLKNRVHTYEKYYLNKGMIIKDAKTLPMVCGGVVTLFYEFIGVKNYIYIFGAGHVGQALAHVLKPLNFHMTVIDHRKEIIEPFLNADEKVDMGFADYIDKHGIKEGSYVVICTPSHTYDYHVLNKIIEKKLKPKYMGMLCSLEKLKDYLKKTYDTFGENIDLSNFYSPIGLDLGGGSIEEIAISIASEILALHHGKKGHKHLRGLIDDHDRYW